MPDMVIHFYVKGEKVPKYIQILISNVSIMFLYTGP
jgi:hypothetical protein